MAKSKPTHTGVIITREGRKRFRLTETRSSYSVKSGEAYDKETGFRWGAPNMRRKLLLDTIRPIEEQAK